MSAPTPPSPSPIGLGVLAAMAAVLTLSLLVFAYGFLSLFLDLNVVDQPDAGPLLGPAMALAVCAIVVRSTLTLGRARLGRAVFTAALASAFLPPAIGAAIYVVNRGQFGVFPAFFGNQVLSPFSVAAAVVAAIVVSFAGLARQPRS